MTAGSDDTIEVVPERMVAGGAALAHTGDGRVLFVSGGLPAEPVRVRVTEKRRDFWRADVVDVVSPSPHRVLPPCPAVAEGCGGCQWQHIDPAAQTTLKADIVADALRRLGRIDEPPVLAPIALPAAGYRTTARFGITPGGRLGFRKFHGHDLVDAGACLVLHPRLAGMVAEARFPAAEEVTLRTGARTGERLAYAYPSAKGATVPAGVVIADRRRTGHYHEEAAGRRWRISAPSFFQVRPDGADVLAAEVGGLAGSGDGRVAVDLYAGVGLFAGALADRGWTVVAVEGSRPAAADARHNVREARVVHADVTVWRPRPAAVVVADPSRSGLGPAGVAVVAGCEPDVVVLVSCDPAALGRDASLLAAHGYRLESALPVDLFPHTFHVEVVSRFRRV